jgi:glutaredoxin 3
MGRITIFSIQDCPNCQRIKAGMNEHNIPYTEISLTTHPQRRVDMLSLSDKLTVPQVFLNETLIGGTEETLKLFQQCVSIPNAYENFCGRADEPKDPRLAPTVGPGVAEPPPPPRQDQSVPLPPHTDQTATPQFTSVLEITELLKKILPREDLKQKLKTYRNSFRAKDAVSALMNQYQLSESQAVDSGKILQKLSILDHVAGEHEFENTGMFFRLHCDQTPDVLNSYRIWTERVDPNSLGLLQRLKRMLSKIESAHTDNLGKVNYKAALSHPDFPAFEEAVCELQKVSYSRLPYETKLVSIVIVWYGIVALDSEWIW